MISEPPPKDLNNRNTIIRIMFLFINRKEEIRFLQERYCKKGFEFIIIYGRRRIGKTELIKKFVKNKPHIYFLCNKAGTSANMSRFKEQAANFFSQPKIATEKPEEIFEHIASQAKEKIVVVFDEFPYLVEKDSSIPSVFQQVVDEVLKKKNLMLILCGSSVSMMEELLGYKNPLYGRKTGHMKISSLGFRHIKEFFPGQATEEIVKIYAILGGVPFYLEKFDKNESAIKNAKKQILSKWGSLYEEADFLLKEKFREPDVYKAILSAAASGSTKLAEIACKAKIRVTDMDKYLKALIRVGILKKDIPITERKSKKTSYSIDDNFFDFYSMFFEPNRSDIEIGETKNVDETLKKKFNMYLGRKFEKLVRSEMLARFCPFAATKKGRWWGFHRVDGQRKELEIDAVAFNDATKDILFVECKWKDIRLNDAEKIIEGLKEKSKFVQWNNGARKEHFAIIAKKIDSKKELRNKGILAFDLEDF